MKVARFSGAIVPFESASRTWYSSRWREPDGTVVVCPARTKWVEAFADRVTRPPLLVAPRPGLVS